MKNSDNRRRKLIAGLVATVGYGLYPKAAAPFPAGTRGAVQAASSILKRFGIGVEAVVDGATGRDVLRFVVEPHQDIQYEQIVNMAGGDTCWIVTSFQDAVLFTNYNMSTGYPELNVSSQGGRTEIEVVDPNASMRVTVAGGAVYELQNGELVIVDR